jgi:hypothetical protein
MYAVTSNRLVKRTRAYLRSAEFGFLGVIVPTRVQTPRFCGELTFVNVFLELLYPLFKAGEFDFTVLDLRGLRTNWLIVGIDYSSLLLIVVIPHIQVVHFWVKNKVFVFIHKNCYTVIATTAAPT